MADWKNKKETNISRTKWERIEKAHCVNNGQTNAIQFIVDEHHTKEKEQEHQRLYKYVKHSHESKY